MKRHDLIQYILDEVGNEGQRMLSSIGFEADKLSSDFQIKRSMLLVLKMVNIIC